MNREICCGMDQQADISATFQVLIFNFKVENR